MTIDMDNRPFHMYEENDKYRGNEYNKNIDWKDDTPCDVLKSYIDWQLYADSIQIMDDIHRPKIETWEFEEMRKRAGYTQEQINEEIVKIYPKEFANEYLNKTQSYYKAMQSAKEIDALFEDDD